MQHFYNDNAGGVAIIFAGGLFVLLVGVGAAVDYSRLTAERTELQKRSDAAALAGAQVMVQSLHTQQNHEDEAVERAREVLGPLPGGDATIAVSLADNEVQVDVATEHSLVFGAFLGLPAGRVDAFSVARFDAVDAACVLALDADAPIGIQTHGSGALEADLCTIWSNSSSPSSVSSGGASTFRGNEICAVGGASGTGMSPSPRTGCSALPDPFADRDLETTTNCSTPPSMSSGGSYTLSPGSYCGMSVKGDVSLEPGIYTIVGQPFQISGNALIQGDGVTIILADDAFLDWTGTPQIALNAPLHGPTAGIVIAATRDNTATSTIAGNVEADLESELRGSIYLPAQALITRGNVSLTMHDARGRLVAGTVSVRGNSRFRILADDDFLREETSPNIRLTQ